MIKEISPQIIYNRKSRQNIFLENGMITGIGNHTDLFDNHDRYKQYVLYQLNK